MNEPFEYINTITKAIVERVNPEKVILFGSYAYGTPSKESDIDILVILKDSSVPRYKRSGDLYTMLKDYSSYPKDLIVYTEDEVKKWANVRQAFITSVIKKGKLLYERKN